MIKNFLFCFLIVSSFWVNNAMATVFAGNREAPRVQIKEADFLKAIGVVAATSKVSDKPNSDLKVSFTSSQILRYTDIFVELLLLDSGNQILLTVEAPFVNAGHTVSYIVPNGYSLVVSIAMPVSEETEYYKVTFSQ